MRVIPQAVFLAKKSELMTGDIVGFVTHRPNLDYFHVGFVIIGPEGGVCCCATPPRAGAAWSTTHGPLHRARTACVT